jgi:hypothetical protein
VPVVARIKVVGCTGSTVTLDGRKSSGETRWAWNFDGTVKTGGTVSFDYDANDGPHVVILTVRGAGGTSTAYTTVTTPCP